MVRIKRIYDPADPKDGVRILVDRLWPRGVRKESARITEWRKELAPSTGLRKWFGHDPDRWEAFRERYRRELREGGQMDALRAIARLSKKKRITLIYSAADEGHNQAAALKEVLEELLHSHC